MLQKLRKNFFLIFELVGLSTLPCAASSCAKTEITKNLVMEQWIFQNSEDKIFESRVIPTAQPSPFKCKNKKNCLNGVFYSFPPKLLSSNEGQF